MVGRGLTGALLASAVLLPAAAAAHRFRSEEAPVVVVPGGRVRLDQHGRRTIISGIVKGGGHISLALPADATIPGNSLYAARFVGGVPGRVLILSVDYTSRPPGAPLAECGAGMETVLRVIALRPQPRQTFHQLVASCWKDIDPGEITWGR